MKNYVEPEIQKIIDMNIKNKRCFDCGDSDPKWVSLNHGIFLCLKCAGLHRNFKLNISTIRSIEIDSWNKHQLLSISLGGNENFEIFLKEYNLLNDNLNLKYKSKASDYYRQLLKFKINKCLNPRLNYNNSIFDIDKPSLEEGNKLIEKSDETSFISQKGNSRPSIIWTIGKLIYFSGKKLFQTSYSITESIINSVINMKIKQKIIIASSFIKDQAQILYV